MQVDRNFIMIRNVNACFLKYNMEDNGLIYTVNLNLEDLPLEESTC